MKRPLCIALLALFTTGVAAAASRAWTADDVRHKAAKRTRLAVEGRIDRAINFDYFILADDTGEILLNAASVKQRLAAGDRVVVWGRYIGISDRFKVNIPEIEAMHIAAEGTPEAEKLLASPGAQPPAGDMPPPPAATAPAAPAEDAAVPPPPPPPPEMSVEDRLKTLEDLKSKGLVTDDEYRDQRKRILDDL